MPSWDQTIPTATRFLLLSNFNDQAFLDRNTGLVWQANPTSNNTNVSQFTAVDDCNRAFIGGLAGWRLPTLQELTSLFAVVQNSTVLLTLDMPSFVTLPTAPLWTSTLITSDEAYYLEKSNPITEYFIEYELRNKTSSIVDSNELMSMWCVRGPTAGTAY